VEVELPETLARYFAAQNAHDVEAMVACFAPDATVRDEGQDHGGKDAIRRWQRQTVAKYEISIAPLDIHEEQGLTSVVARVTGDFPGSPIDLTHSFGLSSDGLIRTLKIH
jgi:ketosteroid isomerase-like protein